MYLHCNVHSLDAAVETYEDEEQLLQSTSCDYRNPVLPDRTQGKIEQKRFQKEGRKNRKGEPKGTKIEEIGETDA